MRTITVGAFLLLAGITDIRKKRISTVLLGLFLLGIIPILYRYGTLGQTEEIREVFLGAIPGLCLFVLSKATHESIGMGDVYFLGIMGLYVGWRSTVFITILGLFFLSFFAIILLVMKKGSKETELAFIPFLFLGFLVQTIR